MKSGLEATVILERAQSLRMLRDIYNWNHLLSALRLLHQCVFTLQPLEQHSKQIYRKPKANWKKEKKNLGLFNMQF